MGSLLWALACSDAPDANGETDAVTADSTTARPDDDGTDGRDDDHDDAADLTDDAADSETSDPATGDDAIDDTSDGASTGGPSCADRPAPDAPWIAAYQEDIMQRLTGQVEALPGVTLGIRQSPAARAATGDYLLSALDALGLESFEHSYSATGRNVYATLPSTDGGQDVYVLGAHFDTVPGSPGANDNATGVAMVLAAARYMSEMECRTANVIVVLFDEEEIGLVGSANFAAFLEAQDLPVVAVHTVDQMGWDSDGDRTIEIERPDDGLFELYEQAAQAVPQPIAVVPTSTGSTDHVSFRDAGFAAVGLTEEFVSGDTTRHYHLPSDAYMTVDGDYLRSTSIVVHEVFGTLLQP